MSYLNKNMQTVLEKSELMFLDMANNNNVLSIVDDRLPFRMKGGADVFLADKDAKKNLTPLAGIRMVIALKKNVEEKHKPQAFGQLISSSLMAPRYCAPLSLLTDLNNHWCFTWFNEEKFVSAMTLHCPKSGFAFIEAVILEQDNQISIPFVTPARPMKRLKIDDFLPELDDGAYEELERYELMADSLEPSFLNERRMEYAEHLVKNTPIFAGYSYFSR